MGREGWFDEVAAFYDEHLKDMPPAAAYPAFAVQDSTGAWRAEDRWPTSDRAVTVGLGGGSYVDDGAPTGGAVIARSTPVERAVRITGTPHVTVESPDRAQVMVRLHERVMPQKQLTIETQGLDRLPRLFGDGDEIRRLLYNVLSNAFKYSYHSVPSAHRTIRVFSKVPYDPGFRERRFALVVENYGLGVTDEERRKVFQPGFRGERARRDS